MDLGPHLLEHALLPCLEKLPPLHPMFVAVPAACRATRELGWGPMFDTIFRKRWPALYDHVRGEGQQAAMRQTYMQVLWARTAHNTCWSAGEKEIEACKLDVYSFYGWPRVLESKVYYS